MSEELIKDVIEDVVKSLPLDAEGFRMKVEEMLRYRNICSDVVFYFDEYPSIIRKKQIEYVDMKVLNSIDELVCDDKRYNIYTEIKTYEFHYQHTPEVLYIIDTYRVSKVEEQKE